jgi:hypothetical protein
MDTGLIEFSLADPDFYAPLTSMTSDQDSYRPSRTEPGWRCERSGIWSVWHRGGYVEAADGWKVHVSARHDRVQRVLDQAASICFGQGVPFKHLSNQFFYWWTNYKYAPRSAGGKFIAAYPGDVTGAWRLMEALREALADEEGPYILSDRRFKDSRTVHYRYGAFVPMDRIQADGTRLMLVRDANGTHVPDRRGVSFQLPPGVSDPFIADLPVRPVPSGPVQLGDFAIDSARRHSNAGGIYLAHHGTTGRPVLIKEGRSHTGLREDNATATEQLRAEWETLTALHALAPGLAPEPVSYFTEWEHEFLAMELVDGKHAGGWVATQSPLLLSGTTAQDFARYYERCEKILATLERDLDRMHRLGYLYVDIGPGNLLIGPDDTARLVDFGSAQRRDAPFTLVGTPGYSPPPSLVGDDLTVYDDYGVSAIAQLLLGPMHQVLERNPGALRYVHHDLHELAPVPPALWARATRYHRASDTTVLPRPEEVAADPLRYLRELRDGIADGLVAMADCGHAERVFPTTVQGYRTNTVCVAYGTAGVLHALRQAGRPIPEELAARFRRDALSLAGTLAPGLYVGLAGIAWVLADLGLLDEAADLLAMADGHPLTRQCATIYGGSAGVALAHLALFEHTRDEAHLGRALALAAALPHNDSMPGYLGPEDPTGLMHGPCGIALLLQQLAGITGDAAALARGLRLLHAELDRAVDPLAPGLLFPVSRTDRRQMPYLYCGSAGMAVTVTRYLRDAHDDKLASALPRLLAPLRKTYAAMPALCTGLAGFAFALADHALLTGAEPSRQDAVRVARALFKYAIPHATGVRYLGDQMLRYSAELWTGSAGVLLALTQVLSPRPGMLFTVDTTGTPAQALAPGGPRESACVVDYQEA